MSNEFNALRARARAKRDKEIAAVRAEYEATLVQIATLEQDLLGKVTSRYRKISAAIESVIPSDRPFSTADIMAGLEALDPGRVWRKRAIDSHISRLRERGLVKRLKRATAREPAVYSRADLPVKVVPLGDKTLQEVIRGVVTRPMTVTEVAVAVKESGYKSEMSNGNLRSHVRRLLVQGGFRQEGGKWTLAAI